MDITDPNLQATFTNPSTGLPVRSDVGAVPIFDSNLNLLRTIQAQIYLSGDIYQFPMNYPGWTNPHTFDQFLTLPPGTVVQPSDTGPSSFYTAAGALQVPTSDPWGFTGEA